MDMTVAIFHLSSFCESFEAILCHSVWLISWVQEARDKWEFHQLMIAQINALESIVSATRKVYTVCSIHLSSLHVYSWHFVLYKQPFGFWLPIKRIPRWPWTNSMCVMWNIIYQLVLKHIFWCRYDRLQSLDVQMSMGSKSLEIHQFGQSLLTVIADCWLPFNDVVFIFPIVRNNNYIRDLMHREMYTSVCVCKCMWNSPKIVDWRVSSSKYACSPPSHTNSFAVCCLCCSYWN